MLILQIATSYDQFPVCREYKELKYILLKGDTPSSKLIIKNKNKILYQTEILNNPSIIDNERVNCKDFNSDNLPEIIVNTTFGKKESYEIFSYSNKKILPFFPHSLSHFELQDGKIIDYSYKEDLFTPVYKIYCLKDKVFRLCESKLTLTNHVKTDNSKTVRIDSDIYKELDGQYYTIIKFKDQELLFVYLNEMLNKCGILLKKNLALNSYDQYFFKNKICNLKIIDRSIISSYRNKGQLDYRYFQLKNGILVSFEENKLTQKTLTQYNNIAYHLQKAGAHKEAVYLLEKILEKFPNRTVAYYNLADGYWALGDKDKARKSYSTYIEQMCHKGLQKKIPKEVLKRVAD